MKRLIGILGMLISLGCVIVGFIWIVRIIVDQWGPAMGGIAVLVFPATLAFMPWYAGLVLGNWWVIALIWGGCLAGTMCQAAIEE